jgi:hypothetical protein
MIRFLLLVILLAPTLVLSQSFLDSSGNLPLGIKEQVSIDVLPKIPRPGEDFTISIESFSTDLNKAAITWTVNGVTELRGTGLVTFNGKAPSNGNTLNIVVTMVKNTGGTLTESIKISPAEVELIYEAQTYTHPFYRGKSLYTNESNVRIVAFPRFVIPGGEISPENLVYTWKVDRKVMQSQSGFGKSILDYKGSLIARPLKVEVTVESLTLGLIAKNSITLQTSKPGILLYEKNPVYGTLFGLNLNNKEFNFNRTEIDVVAEPFFFSTERDGKTNLEYEWTLNGNSTFNLLNENSMLFRKTPESSGVSKISVSTKHISNILQSSKSSVTFSVDETEQLEDFEF